MALQDFSGYNLSLSRVDHNLAGDTCTGRNPMISLKTMIVTVITAVVTSLVMALYAWADLIINLVT